MLHQKKMLVSGKESQIIREYIFQNDEIRNPDSIQSVFDIRHLHLYNLIPIDPDLVPVDRKKRID